MLTVSTMSGAWAVSSIIDVGGSAWGLRTANWTWIVSLPITGTRDVTTFKGSISSGPLDRRGDRDCSHYQIEGSIIHHGNKFTRSIINPVGSGYVGPPIRIEQFYFPCSGRRNSFTAAGIITQGLTPWEKHFPDHSYDNFYYRNCWIQGEVNGNQIRIVTHWEFKASYQSSWTIHQEYSPWCEFNLTSREFRRVGSSSWSSLRSLVDTSVTNLPVSGRLSSNDWSRILGRLSRIHPGYRDRDIFGDLCRRCANDAQLLDLNGIEYLADIRSFTSDLKSLLSLLKGKATLKSAAKLFLTYKYGMKLTVTDTISIFQSIPRHLESTSHDFRWARAAESTIGQSCSDVAWTRVDNYHYKVYYEPYDSGLVNLVDQLWSVGLFPSLQNSWDLIPLSFVVDWFTQISERLSAYDASTFWSCNKVLGGLGSRKTIFGGVQGDVIFPSLSNSAGVATVTEYARFGTDTIVTPTFFNDAPRDFKNYAEATALLIARSKRLK